MGPARIDRTIPWLLMSLVVVVSVQASGLGKWLSWGTLGGWTAGTAAEIPMHSAVRRNNTGNSWSTISAANAGTQTIRVSGDFRTAMANSQGQSATDELTSTDSRTDSSGFLLTSQRDNRNLSTSALPAPNSVEWIASPPGFELRFVIAATTDRAYDSLLASFEDCSTPLSGSGLSALGPQFLPDQMTLTDTVAIDIDQLSATVYQVDNAQSTMATLQFCHVLTMYSRDANSGAVSSSSLHRSSTKVSADINLLRPFTTPSAIQLSAEPADGSVDVDGGLSPDVNVFTCNGDKQEIQLTTATSGDTIRICVGTSPPPDSITDINLAATPLSGGATELYSLVSSGRIQRIVPGEITLGDCNNNVCSFDYSPQFSFFLDSPYSLTLTGTIRLRIGNSRRQTRKLPVSIANARFGLTVETAVFTPEGPSDTGLSKVGVTAIVILLVVAISMAAVFWYHRRNHHPIQAVELQQTEKVGRDKSDEFLADKDGGDSLKLFMNSPPLDDNEAIVDDDSTILSEKPIVDAEEAVLYNDKKESTMATVKPQLIDDDEALVEGGASTELYTYPDQLDHDEFSVDINHVGSEGIFAYPRIRGDTVEFSDTEV